MTKKKTPFEICMDVVNNGSEKEKMILLLAILTEKSNRVDRGEWKND